MMRWAGHAAGSAVCGLRFLAAAGAILAGGCTAAAGPVVPLRESPAATGPSPSPFLPQADSPVPTNAPLPEETAVIPSPTASLEAPMNTQSPEPLTITILYNNIASDPRLRTDWGFSALVEHRGETLLFDTGADGSILMQNLRTMGVDPLRIRDVVLSHAHSDHTGGLSAFLDAAAEPRVYLLPEFGAPFWNSVRRRTEVVEAAPGMEISAGIHTTGNVGGAIPEQSLAIRTGRGIVILTGCAHPGIVRIVEKAVELTGDPVYLVAGGFHLLEYGDSQIAAVLADFRRLGVRKVAPSHCTGERAIALFAAEYGEDFLQTGAGSVLHLEG